MALTVSDFEDRELPAVPVTLDEHQILLACTTRFIMQAGLSTSARWLRRYIERRIIDIYPNELRGLANTIEVHLKSHVIDHATRDELTGIAHMLRDEATFRQFESNRPPRHAEDPFTAAAASRALGVSKSTIQRWIKTGQIEAFAVTDRGRQAYRIPASEIAERGGDVQCQ